MQVAYPAVMAYDSPRQVRRRENLQRLLDENGGAAQVAREVSTPKTHFSAILAGRRGLGDLLAQKLERHFDKPAGWIDSDLTDQTALPVEISELAAEAAALPPELRGRLLTMWRGALDLARQSLNANAGSAVTPSDSITDVRQVQR